MKQFHTIEKIDTGILYCLELASSVSVLLLAFGLIASMANVLTKGSVLTDNLIMQRIWAWTQCIAIDASVAGTIIRTFRFHSEGERVKTSLYALLSALLLFTAAIVSNIEAVQQTLNITLEKAYIHVFVPVEALIWIRSIAIVLLIVAHAMRHVQLQKRTGQAQDQIDEKQSLVPAPQTPKAIATQTSGVDVQVQPLDCSQLAFTPELVATLRQLIIQTTTIREETQGSTTLQALPQPKTKKHSPASKTTIRETPYPKRKNSTNYQRVKAYMTDHQRASVREVAGALNIGISTANKWMQRVNVNDKTSESEQAAETDAE